MPRPDLAALADHLRTGALPALPVTLAAVAAAEDEKKRYNAWIAIHPDAPSRAEALDRIPVPARGALHGVPIAVKDNVDEAGVPCSAGCRAYRDRIPTADAPAVQRLRAAGAVIVGRTNLHELADGVTSENPWFGPVHHPLRPGWRAGGSSGGSAVAVAAGSVTGALGTDTGGSIRIPASLCGIVGFKPSRGAVPGGGVVPLSAVLDHVGPLATTVAGARRLFRVLASCADPGPKPSLDGLRIGVLDGFGQAATPGVGDRFTEALARLEAGGARLSPVSLPGLAQGLRLLAAIYQPEAAAWHAGRLAEAPADFGADVRQDLERALGRDPAKRQAALAAAEILAGQIAASMDGLDLLACPTTPHPSTPHGTRDAHTYLAFTCPFNLSGQPALSVPMGDVDGLPVGLQLVGRQGADLDVLAAAEAFEGLGT